MFDSKADLFFEDPRHHRSPPGNYGVLHLLRRDIYRCFDWNLSEKAEQKRDPILWPGGMAILAGIDLLAKFHEGDDAIGCVGQRFRDFVGRYFQPLCAKDEETIYQLRNSLLHSFGLYSRTKTTEYRFVLSASREQLVQQISVGNYQVDLVTLFERFEGSVQRYGVDLNADAELQTNFCRMFSKYGSIRIG
ncbi:MAG: hypothetical protein C4532_10875 [Candidatus Abyssobacteria bacterium SURF_17]|uniref:Uncharacterized protein n=1 Tax=Candidatus Abyssobacteria bacterium SURF_17 TaxID=2093361 RepID=A0A419EXJ1_9BACT|nr:MAG: hypothetical protein C4532_10875 [Candidatus Abyssubacteria bacterium SURF_17]